MDISGKVKEAETYYEMGLFEESLSIYEKILYNFDEPDQSAKDAIGKKIMEIRTMLESLDQDQSNEVSSEQIEFFKKALSLTDADEDRMGSAAVFKESGLFREAVSEYGQLLGQRSSWDSIFPDLVICLMQGFRPSEILDRVKELIDEKNIADKFTFFFLNHFFIDQLKHHRFILNRFILGVQGIGGLIEVMGQFHIAFLFYL